MTFELQQLQDALDEWGEELLSRQGKFALIALSAEIRALGEHDPLTAAEFLKFNKSVDAVMKQVNQAERDHRVDFLRELEKQARDREAARTEFGAVPDRNLQ